MPERRRDLLVVRPQSVFAVVAVIAGALFVARVLVSATRVLGWIAMAAGLALVLGSVVDSLARRVPRGLAVLAVVAGVLVASAAVATATVADVVRQTEALRREAPELARRLERDGRFADVAREARLAERVGRAMDDVPTVLQGGSASEALRTATSRGIALLAITVLTVFFLLHGNDVLHAALAQAPDDRWRARLRAIGEAVHRRALPYARGVVGMAAAAGLVAYALARLADVPGAAPLALWVAVWDLVPLLGAAVGAVPIVALAAVQDPTRGWALALAFVAYQVFEVVVLQRPLERRTMRLGPFVTALAGFGGLEMYGISGALLGVLAAACAVAAVEAVAEAGEAPVEPSEA